MKLNCNLPVLKQSVVIHPNPNPNPNPKADEGLEAALQAIADLPEHMEEPVPLQEEAPVEVAGAEAGHVDEVTQLTPGNEF